jgi:hypothetical protein
MEVAVKATGYAAIFRTNSVDVKNIAHDEQSDCLFQGDDFRPVNQQIAANLVETRAQQSPLT